MTVQPNEPVAATPPVAEVVDDDPFGLDISFIEGTPAAESVLMCTTGDNCGQSCPSACANSAVG